MVSDALARSQIKFVLEECGEEGPGFRLAQVIQGLEHDLEQGKGVAQSEIQYMMELLRNKKVFDGNEAIQTSQESEA